jgi:redox-sensitive bicupin YhaK (pirin superfamily)
VIAGAFGGANGPARTFTPINVWDLRLDGREPTDVALPDGHTTALVVLRGALSVNGSEPIRAAEVALFDRKGSGVRIDRAESATALLLSGEPIGEPIVGHGPFVMNRPEEIDQAIRDYRTGKMGHL